MALLGVRLLSAGNISLISEQLTLGVLQATNLISSVYLSVSGPRMDISDSTGERETQTITRADLVERVYLQIGLPRSECAALVEAVIASICDAAVKGENIKLSSFGTFVIRQKNHRIGRNPKTGEEVPIAPRKVMTFKPSNILRSKVNGDVGDESQ